VRFAGAGERANRDTRLDFWRGLCLIDVVLVHLAYNGVGFPSPLDELIKHWTRFAAGGFVFLSGLSVAVAFSARIAHSREARWETYRRLWRRAAQLVLIDVAATVVYRTLEVARGLPADDGAPFPRAIADIVLLQRPGVTGGILPLYALLLAAMPVVFEVRRRRGTLPIAFASASLYAAAVASDGALAWPRNDFPFAYWQPLFLAGFLAAQVQLRLAGDVRRRRLLWAAIAAVAFAVVFLAHHGPSFGIGEIAAALPLDFRKVPLGPGALLWYVTSIQLVLAVSALAWDPVLARSRVAGWAALLGRHSLLVYVAHVFTEAAVLEYVWRVWPPALLRIAVAVADVLALGLLCAAIEARLPARLARLTRAAPARLVGAGVAAGVFVLTTGFVLRAIRTTGAPVGMQAEAPSELGAEGGPAAGDETPRAGAEELS
jgi:hypothetical protein